MLKAEDCYIPSRSELLDEGLGGNRSYQYFGKLTWDDARECLNLERLLLHELRGTTDKESAKNRFILEAILGRDSDGLSADAIADAVYDDQMSLSDTEAVIYILDAGCAAAVCSLYAAGCAPVTSCNGAAFGGLHQYAEPTIAFYANRKNLDLLNAAAEKAGVTLDSGGQGVPVMVATTPEQFSDFAKAMIELRLRIKPFRIPRETDTTHENSEQLRLL